MSAKPRIKAIEVINKHDFGNLKLLRVLFETLNKYEWGTGVHKNRITYSEAFPHITEWSGSARSQVGLTLGALWEWCAEQGYPELNFAVVSKETGRPSEDIKRGVASWYIDTFGTLEQYDSYCSLKGELAYLFLKNNMIILEP